MLGWLALTNTATSIRRVKIYDKATAPTAADTPVQTYELPPAAAGGVASMVVPLPAGAVRAGMGFGNGIGFRITTGQADGDANAATAGDVVVNYGYG